MDNIKSKSKSIFVQWIIVIFFLFFVMVWTWIFAFKKEPENNKKLITSINTSTKGCLIKDPDGKIINLKETKAIPKGSLITPECVEDKNAK